MEVDLADLAENRKNVPHSVRQRLTGSAPVGNSAVVGANGRTTRRAPTRGCDSRMSPWNTQ